MSTFKGFSSVELKAPKRSLFDLSHERRLSGRLGRLMPIFISETIPNDTFRLNSEVMVRLAPLIAPIMHRLNVVVHFFFIPNRLLWKDWEAFITGGRLGTETPPVPPNATYASIGGRALSLLGLKQLGDYLGHPPKTDAECTALGARTVDLMPFAAYFKLWHDYYRDRNYIADSTILPMASGTFAPGADMDLMMAIKVRDWEKDMFTSALPWTQRGNQVLLPMLSVVDTVRRKDAANITVGTHAIQDVQGVAGPTAPLSHAADPGVVNIQLEGANTTVTINDFRRAIYLQQWMERNALAGSRYNESIWAHFNRRTSDGRLQRAEYLGGGKVPVQIGEVLTTAFSNDGVGVVPPADPAGKGMSFGNSNRFTYNCEEHGFIIGVMSVMPTSAYNQGTPRMFLGRNSFLDYPWPTFAHLGEQPVYNYELYSDTSSVPVSRASQPIFGYQARYVDWKWLPSSSHGEFRTTLEIWTLVRKFAAQPVLGSQFVGFEDALQDRVFAVGAGTDNLWIYLYNKCTVVRSLPYFGSPGGLTHG